MGGFLTVEAPEDQTAYMPLNGFTTVDIGCERGNNSYNMISKLDAQFAEQYIKLFNEIWNDKTKMADVTETVIENISNAYNENSPEFIYFMMLYHVFSEFLDDISEDVLPNEASGFKQSKIWNMLYDFQRDAALAIIHKLEMSEFKELWKRINSKSYYVVNFDTDELIKKSIAALDSKLRISRISFRVESGAMESIQSKNTLLDGEAFKKSKSDSYDVKVSANANVKYDLVGKIVEETGLTRKAVVSILQGIQPSVFNQFRDNPEEFISMAATIINNEKATSIIEHITYSALDDQYGAEIFTEPTIKGKLICVWHHGAVDVLNAAWKVTFGNAFRYKTVCAGRKVRSKMGTNVSERPSMYAIADALHIEQQTAHCSDHDVSLLRNILIALEIGRTDLEGEPSTVYVPSTQLSRREKNVGIIAGSGHRFVFAHDSAVFHRSDCKLVLNARSIEGCSYYQKAIQKRRPCKVCNPRIEDGLDRLPKTSPVNKKAPAYDPNDEVIRTKMLGHVYLDIRRGKIVGCCHSLLHPGKLTLKLMKEHDCLGKNCPRFEKYDDSPYWTEVEKKKAGKALSRKIQQEKKEKDRIAAEELEDFKEIFQSFADDAGYAMEIIRIERLSFRYFRIFYVSEYRFADGNRFPVFFNTTKFFYPEIRIELRHIKDVDGHFVTIDEYHSRKR